MMNPTFLTLFMFNMVSYFDKHSLADSEAVGQPYFLASVDILGSTTTFQEAISELLLAPTCGLIHLLPTLLRIAYFDRRGFLPLRRFLHCRSRFTRPEGY
jgi:hypothetical protein